MFTLNENLPEDQQRVDDDVDEREEPKEGEEALEN